MSYAKKEYFARKMAEAGCTRDQIQKVLGLSISKVPNWNGKYSLISTENGRCLGYLEFKSFCEMQMLMESNSFLYEYFKYYRSKK